MTPGVGSTVARAPAEDSVCQAFRGHLLTLSHRLAGLLPHRESVMVIGVHRERVNGLFSRVDIEP